MLLAKKSPLSLLQRSVGFGHGKLALARLAMAVQADANVPAPHWIHCRQAASKSRAPTLHALFQGAERVQSPDPDPFYPSPIEAET